MIPLAKLALKIAFTLPRCQKKIRQVDTEIPTVHVNVEELSLWCQENHIRIIIAVIEAVK